MKPTITDIAKDTGLSLATISKYLNHKSIRPQNAKISKNDTASWLHSQSDRPGITF